VSKGRLGCFLFLQAVPLLTELPNRREYFPARSVRRIFGPKRDEVTGEWRKLHNEELRD
jgi:hypothetical protein